MQHKAVRQQLSAFFPWTFTILLHLPDELVSQLSSQLGNVACKNVSLPDSARNSIRKVFVLSGNYVEYPIVSVN